MLTIKILSPEDLVPLCNQVICRSSGSGIIAFLVFPQFQNCSDIMRKAPPLQRRVRTGISPVSLLAFVNDERTSTLFTLFNLEYQLFKTLSRSLQGPYTTGVI